MGKSELVIRFLISEGLLFLAGLFFTAGFSIIGSGAVFYWWPLHSKHEKSWAVVATIAVICLVVACTVFPRAVAQGMWPPWLVASWTVILLLPVAWLLSHLRAMSPNYSLKRTAANRRGVD